MKAFSLILLLTVLFTADYAMAQTCPCDTEQLQNGLSGNDLVDIICPGGTIAEGNIWTLNPSVVAISGEFGNGSGAAYQVLTIAPDFSICEITDFVNPPVDVTLTDQQLEACRARLIAGCRLIIIASHNIPTLSEWGMIAMAGVLGVIGFIVAARRRKALA